MAATEYCHLSSNPWCTTSSVAINPLFEVESRMKIDIKSSKSKKTDKLIYACHMIKRFNVWHEITCPILTYVESHFYHFSKISLK